MGGGGGRVREGSELGSGSADAAERVQGDQRRQASGERGVLGGREGPIQDGGRRLVRHKLSPQTPIPSDAETPLGPG